ncbi:MAG: ParB/RepB/Spo0J family partition protein [Candidatus Desulforudaceae bacterium]
MAMEMTAPTDHYLPGKLYSVPIDCILPNPNNPRKTFDQAALEELAASIKEVGILQPLVVVPEEIGFWFRIVAGERRWRAAQIAGLGVVPVIVKKLTSEQEAQIMLIENLQREDLDPIEEARAYRELTEKHGYKQTELAEKLGVSQSHIANRIRLLKLPETVQQSISAGIIPSSLGKELVAYAGLVDLDKLAQDAAEKSWTTARVIDTAKNRAWENTKALHKTQEWREPPAFNLGTCEGCRDRTDMVRPYGNDTNKWPRCLKPKCWDKKQREVSRAAQEQRHAEVLTKAQEMGYSKDQVVNMAGKVWGSYGDLRFGGFGLASCSGCEHKALGYSGAATSKVCLNAECFNQKRDAIRKAEENEKKTEIQLHKMLVDRVISEASEWDRTMLLFLAAQCIANSFEWGGDEIEELCQRYGWEIDDDGRIEHLAGLELVERLQVLPDGELRRIVAFCLIHAAEPGDVVFQSLLANWQLPASADEPEPEPICTGPIGKVWRDNKGREIFVSSGLGQDSFGTFYRAPSGGFHRVKSNRMPMVGSEAIARENLDKWAAENKLEEVVGQ